MSILPEKGVAFVMYQSILNAEFAKEAMQNQKLESDEVCIKCEELFLTLSLLTLLGHQCTLGRRGSKPRSPKSSQEKGSTRSARDNQGATTDCG